MVKDGSAGDALGRLKASRDQHKKPERFLAANAAASSHLKNDNYMNTFHRAMLRDLEEISTEEASVSAAQHPQPGKGNAVQASQLQEYASIYPPAVVDGWISGPVNESGSAVDFSDRPILCSAANWQEQEVVVGSADHALYVLDTNKLKQKRQLYNKTNGHEEWVTCVTYLSNGCILSGGMDSNLCLWTKSGSKCHTLKGHTGSVSQVRGDNLHRVAVSASYDKTIRVWGLEGKCRATLTGHAAPILELESNQNGGLASGDRSGQVKVWDIDSATCTWELRNVHKGHVTAIAFADPSGGNSMWSGCFATGGQDGRFRLWDTRGHSNPGKVKLHAGQKGTGAVSGIVMGGAAASYMTATCGADNTVRILDARSDISELACIDLPDYPYSFAAAGGLLLAGCGDGSVVVIDIPTLEVQYSLRAFNNAVRALECSNSQLITAGDDGQVVSYSFKC